MKINIINKKSIVVLLFIFIITFILSCEKEMSVIHPTPSERVISGTLVDASDSTIGIANAIVTISPVDPSIDFPDAQDTTNQDGYFEITTVVLPTSQPYKLLIDAFGYQIIDTVVSCGCEVLSLEPIKVSQLNCVILVEPQSEDFGSDIKAIPLNNTVEREFTLKNPTDDEITIDSLGVSDNQFSILDNNIVFPYDIDPNEEVKISVSFTPTEIKSFSDTLRVYTNCFNKINSALLQPVSVLDLCGIIISDIVLSQNVVLQDSVVTGTFKIINEFDKPIEIDSIKLPDSFTLGNTTLPFTLVNEDDEQILSFTFQSHDEKTYNGDIEVFTGCDFQESKTEPIPQIIVASRLYSFSDFGVRIDSATIERDLGVGRLNHNITITNESPHFNLSISILSGLVSPFSVEPSISPITIGKQSSQIYTITFDLAETTEREEPYLGTLQLSTNGRNIDPSINLSTLKINLIGDSRIPIPKTDTLFIWNRKVSSDTTSLYDENHLHEGINFEFEKIAGDSILMCGQSQFTPPKFQELQIADFRFDGMLGDDISNPTDEGSISVHNSWYQITPLDPSQPFNFNNFNYQFNSTTSTPQIPNCLKLINVNDVLVIENKVGGQYYIVKIEKIGRKNIALNVDAEFLVISYFKHIPESTQRNN